MPNDKSKLGMVQIFWGDGKGKTTSALGTALRACGNGYKVHLIQFMKNGADSLKDQIPGEIKALEKFPTFTYRRFGADGWVVGEPTPDQVDSCRKALWHVREMLNNESIDIIIADEILYAIQLGILTEDDVINLIDNKPANKELILTGSHTPYYDIFDKADLVTEIRKLKHPYDSGTLAREGLDY